LRETTKKDKAQLAAQVLKPFRRKIDNLDQKIIDLIAERFATVRQVARVKSGYDIPAFLTGRVNEVRENAIKRGTRKGVDPEFLWALYSLMIYHSCAVEENIHDRLKAKKKK
jgi:chorismate mutase